MSKNKVIGNISKKTLGKKVDTVADYIDLAAQMISEYFNQRYKISKRVEDIKAATINALYALKSNFIKSIAEGILLATGLLALVVGIIMVLTRILPLEYVLIGYGLIVTIFVLLRLKVSA